MKQTLKKLIIPVIAGLIISGGLVFATFIGTWQGGTNQDTSNWTGLPYITGGTWATTSDLTLDDLTVNNSFILGGTVGVGGIDMANYLITNIGNASTDFTTGGGLNLAGALSVTGTSTLGITTITNLTLGSVSNTEFGYLDGITSAIQTN